MIVVGLAFKLDRLRRLEDQGKPLVILSDWTSNGWLSYTIGAQVLKKQWRRGQTSPKTG